MSLAALVSFTSVQGLYAQVPLRGPRVYSPACPASGHRPPAPGTLPPALPGRAPLAALSPSIPAGLRSRLVDRKEDGRGGGFSPLARAPPPHAQTRTSPPCAPSRGSALLPGREKRSRFGRRLLKGQHRPSFILSNPAPPSPQTPVGSPQRLWISPSRPLFFTRSVASRARWIGRAGLGVGFVQPVCCGCYCWWKGGSRRGHLCLPGWRAPCLAHLGTDLRAPLAGTPDSPPPRCESLRGVWRPLGVLPNNRYLCYPRQDFFLLPTRPHPPRSQLGMVPQQRQTDT